MSNWHKTVVLGSDADTMIHTQKILSLKTQDDLMVVDSNESTFTLTFENGFTDDRREVFLQLEIPKDSPFYTKFKNTMLESLGYQEVCYENN